MEYKVNAFTKGIHNLFNEELISSDALSKALGWITKDGHIELTRGRVRLGADGGIGSCDGLHTGYMANGTPKLFRKAGTKVQHYNGTAWVDVITGLTAGAPVKFSNYASLAGTFVYIFSTDGIYKICTANPTSYASLYNSAKNFKGIGFIDKGRTILWGRKEDGTGLYGSYIDAQNTTTYTVVSGEATSSLTGTLAFKAGGATRSCFAVVITLTGSGEVFTDNYNGVLTGSLGNTGTINYMTGAYTLSIAGTGTAAYQWEDSNAKGVTDFTKATPRNASEGFIFRQDFNGDPIQTVIPLEGAYYSLKSSSIYKLEIGSVDTTATNEVFRTNIGVPSKDSGVATSKGILLIDTANGDKPIMRIITRNPVGDNFDTTPIFSHFDFSIFNYEDAVMYPYGDFILLACKTSDADANDTILLCDFANNTVDILPFEALSFSQIGNTLYTGDSLSANVYETLTGFDDLGYVIENYAYTKGETYELDDLKKTKKLRIRGMISSGQKIGVYALFDGSTEQLLGTISGDASYVDLENPNTIGLNLIGQDVVGGSDSQVAYPYYVELKIKTPKFRKRKLQFVALGFGFASVEMLNDYDIWTYENRMPKRNRMKQNVSINDSAITDLDEPNY